MFFKWIGCMNLNVTAFDHGGQRTQVLKMKLAGGMPFDNFRTGCNIKGNIQTG